ncbi:MAG: hypothetical protein HQL37_00330 [Alphaproteobacteria bacterium]|nr:hypothetical protein [Alphaproteobacteria bacterium]
MRNGFVLLLGDEGALLVRMQSAASVWQGKSPSPSSVATQELLKELAGARGLPVRVLIDVQDQSYRRETIPRVNRFDRATLIQLRAKALYPGNALRGFMELGAVKGRRETEYLFTGLDAGGVLAQWEAALAPHHTRFRTVALLPIEGIHLVGTLAKSIARDRSKRKPPADHPPPTGREWQLLVSPSALGGYRQIVVRDGELTFTRMTTARWGEDDPEAAADTIAREIRASLGYLGRLGFMQNDTLNLIVLGSAPVGAALARQELPSQTLTTLTPYEAAYRLGLDSAIEPGEPFADLLHVEAFARKPAALVNLRKSRTTSLGIESPSRLAYLASVAMGAAVVAAMGYGGYLGVKLISKRSLPATQGATLASQEKHLAEIREQFTNSPERYEEVAGTAWISGKQAERQYSPFPILDRLAGALGEDVTLLSFDWTQRGLAVDSGAPPKPAATAQIFDTITVRAELLGMTGKITESQQAAKGLLARIQVAFPEFNVTASKMPLEKIACEVFDVNRLKSTTNARAEMEISMARK